MHMLVRCTKKRQYVSPLLFLEVMQCKSVIINRRFGTGRETSINNYQSKLRNIPEERISHLYLGGSLT